jgi:hypothetical protein
MNVKLFAASLGLGLLVASTAQAQIVSADILIGTGPVAGRVTIGDRYPSYRDHYAYRAPVRRVVVERYRPRVIVVERFHRGRDRARYHDRGRFRQVRAYYDGRGHYYDGYCAGLREVTVYEQDGHYYRDNDRYDDDRDDHSYRTTSYGY